MEGRGLAAGQRHAGRHGMPPALDREPRLDRRAHGPAEIDARDRAAGAGGAALPVQRQREGRAAEALLQPRRDKPDDTGVPVGAAGE
ncbi:hypothetical protein D3C87_1828890 [compost metagenome]